MMWPSLCEGGSGLRIEGRESREGDGGKDWRWKAVQRRGNGFPQAF